MSEQGLAGNGQKRSRVLELQERTLGQRSKAPAESTGDLPLSQ